MEYENFENFRLTDLPKQFRLGSVVWSLEYITEEENLLYLFFLKDGKKTNLLLMGHDEKNLFKETWIYLIVNCNEKLPASKLEKLPLV